MLPHTGLARAARTAAACLLVPLAGAVVRGPHQGGGAAVERLGDAPADDLREEHFAIELDENAWGPGTARAQQPPGTARAAGARPRIVGVARCRRLALEGGAQLEWEVRFLEEEARILHVERRDAGERSLVWREIVTGAGRTLSARGPRGGAELAIREWAGRSAFKSEVPAAGAEFPLHLLERSRVAPTLAGEIEVFDPLSRAVEELSASTVELGGGARRIELVRPDGTLAAQWVLRGTELAELQWQGGGLRARRVTAEEHDRILAAPPAPEEPASPDR